MAFCDDPAHHWVRQSWEGMAADPRCPMTNAGGIVTDVGNDPNSLSGNSPSESS